jgi:hypothetical protein
MHKNYRVKPEPRAGHAAVQSYGRMFIFSGRNDFTALKSFDCYHDMWCIDLKKPPAMIRLIELDSAEANSLKIRWTPAKCTVYYLVEIRESEGEGSNTMLKPKTEPELEMSRTIMNKKKKFNLVKRVKVEKEEKEDSCKKRIVINEIQMSKVQPIKLEQLDGIAETKLEDNETTDSETETNALRGSWCMVGIYKENFCTIKRYVAYKVNRSSMSSSNVPNLLGLKHIALVPGRVYFIRVSSLNSCGLSKFCNITGFKTKCDNSCDVISDLKIECHIYFYLITWKSTLKDVDFTVIIEEFLPKEINKTTIYKGKKLMCKFSSDLLRQSDDDFMVRVVHSSNGLAHEAKVHYKNGIASEIINL